MRIANILTVLLIFTHIAFSQSSAAFWLAGGEEQVLPIATNGLIAYYDASNVDSYDPANPGSTWNDLSGNNYHLTNYGATHTTDYGGVFLFDGIDDYMVYEGAINEDVMTFSIWTKGSNITTNCIIDLDDINLTNDLNQELLFFNGVSNDQFAIQSELSGTYELIGNSSYAINENTWYYITFTYNSGTYNLYINNVLISTTTDPSSDLGAFDFFFNGYIGELFFYNRVLTSQELTDNYNATKDRYVEPCDEYYYNTSLLLHMDGANGSTTFTDDSNNNFTVTANGDAQISTIQSKFGGASANFDGVGDYLSVPDNDGIYFNTDFTIELWVYLLEEPSVSKYIFAQWVEGGGTNRNFSLRSTGDFYINRSNTTYSVSIGALPLSTWTHIAFTLENNTLRGFKDGVLINSSTVSGLANNSTAPFGIGAYGTGEYPTNCYIDELRITKGVARYTSNFTPPTAPFQDNACLWDGTQTSLLDEYPGAAAAYSVRALNSAYTGPLMTIRRASDNAEEDIFALANGDLDEDLINYFCSGTTCYVKTLYDQSGNGLNLTQLDAAQPLIYQSEAIITNFGKPSIYFDGTKYLTNVNSLTYGNGLSIYSAVNTQTTGTAIQRIFSDDILGEQGYMVYFSYNTVDGTNFRDLQINDGGGYETYDLSVIPNIPTSLVSFNINLTSKAYISRYGASVGSGSVSTFSNTTITPLGASGLGLFGAGDDETNPSFGQTAKGYFNEIIIYTTDKTSDEAQISGNINTYFSIY